jgi:hypothetical protein
VFWQASNKRAGTRYKAARVSTARMGSITWRRPRSYVKEQLPLAGQADVLSCEDGHAASLVDRSRVHGARRTIRRQEVGG